MRVLRQPSLSLYFSLSLSLYTLDLSQLSNIAICQSRSRSFPATAICMRTRQHGVPIHSFIRIHSSSVFPFPFSILNFRFDSILNDSQLPPLNVRSVPAKCSTWDLSSVSIRNLFSVSFYINIPDSLPIRFIDYLTFGTAAEQTDILLYLCILCCIFLDI